MDNIRIIFVGVLVLLVIGMFGYAYIKTQDLENNTVRTSSDDTREPDADTYGITRIDATHFFRDGTHTIVGELLMPTPCDLLTTDVSIAESFPEQVTVLFDVINNSEGLCAQVITPQRFRVSFDASRDATIGATFRGENVIVNLIAAPEGEDPDDFELFIKG